MKWIRPDDVYVSKCSYRWWCSSCGKVVYYNHGLNAKKIKSSEDNVCKFKYCPWCGEKSEQIKEKK